MATPAERLLLGGNAVAKTLIKLDKARLECVKSGYEYRHAKRIYQKSWTGLETSTHDACQAQLKAYDTDNGILAKSSALRYKNMVRKFQTLKIAIQNLSWLKFELLCHKNKQRRLEFDINNFHRFPLPKDTLKLVTQFYGEVKPEWLKQPAHMRLTIVAQEVVLTPVMIMVGANVIPVDPPQFDTHRIWHSIVCPAPICGEQQLVEMKKKLRRIYDFSKHSPYSFWRTEHAERNFFFYLYVAEVKDAIDPLPPIVLSVEGSRQYTTRKSLETYYRNLHATKWHKTFMLHFEYMDPDYGHNGYDVRVLRWQYANWEMRLYLARNAQRGYSVRNKAGLLKMLQGF